MEGKEFNADEFEKFKQTQIEKKEEELKTFIPKLIELMHSTP